MLDASTLQTCAPYSSPFTETAADGEQDYSLCHRFLSVRAEILWECVRFVVEEVRWEWGEGKLTQGPDGAMASVDADLIC